MKSLKRDLEFRLSFLEVLPGGEVRLSCLEVPSIVPARLHLPLVGKVRHLKWKYSFCVTQHDNRHLLGVGGTAEAPVRGLHLNKGETPGGLELLVENSMLLWPI